MRPPRAAVTSARHRRRYRSLVFCSHRSLCLAELPALYPYTDGLPCGDATALSPPLPSLVITRSLGSGQEQSFLPRRLLRGLLPAATLELYDFWQVRPLHDRYMTAT